MSVFVERTQCPGCESKEFTTVFRDAFASPRMRKFVERKFADPSRVMPLLATSDYELRKCSACTMIYQRSILSDEYAAKLYDEWLLQDDAEHELSKQVLPPDQLAYYANEILLIGRLVKKPHHQIRILDYGMGEGWWCRVAQAFGFDAWGTDLASNLVAKARQKGLNAIDVADVDAHRFDVINTEQVFEHLARPLEVLKRLARSLAKGGIIKISVPDGRGIERRVSRMDWTAPRNSRRFLMPATPLIHINTFTLQSLKAMGARAGLRAVSVPIAYEYSLVNTLTPRAVAKSLVRPLYRRGVGATYVFLRAS